MAVKPKIIRGTLPDVSAEAALRKGLLALIEGMYDAYSGAALRIYKRDEVDIVDVAEDESPTAAIERELRNLLKIWDRRFDDFASRAAEAHATKITGSVTRQMLTALKEAGLTVRFRLSKRVRDKLDACIAENVGLIKSIGRDLHERVSTVVYEGLRRGRDLNYVAEELHTEYGVTLRHAANVARDQTNKANEALTAARCAEVGIIEGIWMHRSGSKKPRKSHEEMSGKRFVLAEGLYDPAVGRKVKPAELPYCRCTFKLVIPANDNIAAQEDERKAA